MKLVGAVGISSLLFGGGGFLPGRFIVIVNAQRC